MSATAAQNVARQARAHAEKAKQKAKSSESVEDHTAGDSAQWQTEMAKTRAAQARAKTRKKKKENKDEGAPYGLGHIGLFRSIGIGMAGLFGFAFVMDLIDEIRYFYNWEWLRSENFTVAGIVSHWSYVDWSGRQPEAKTEALSEISYDDWQAERHPDCFSG